MVELNKTFVVPFNIFINSKFHRVKVANNEVVFQASTIGLRKTIKI